MERPADFRSKLRRNREERRRLLTRGERIFGWTFAFLPAVGAVVAVLLLLGGSAPRAIGIGLLILALLVAATPISPILNARARRRESRSKAKEVAQSGPSGDPAR
jgi:hypothetical protein